MLTKKTLRNIGVSLPLKFAKEVLSTKTDKYTQERMNKIAKDFTKEEFNSHFIFYENSFFVTNFSLIGGKGLETKINPKKIIGNSGRKNVPYHSHNLKTPEDIMKVYDLFDMWATYLLILNPDIVIDF